MPGKNILPLCGKPLIAWSIEAGQGSRYLDKVMVTTDSEQVAGIAKSYGAEVPFLRPAELATDEATGFDVVKHAIDHYSKLGQEYDYVVLLQPTSPLRDSSDIDRAIEYLSEKRADAVVSVCVAEHNPSWCNTLPADRSMEGFLGAEVKNKRSQELKQYYRINGAVYICDIKKLMREKTFYLEKNIYAYTMDAERSVDIDTGYDLALAEFLLIKAGHDN